MNKEELLKGNYAYLIIKNDAITRKIDQEILKYLNNRIIIKEPIRMKLTEEQVKIINKRRMGKQMDRATNRIYIGFSS